MRQAVARGRAVGPRPGRVALRDAADRSPDGLAAVLAAVIADGDPLRDLRPLFDLPHAATPPAGVAPGGVVVRGRRVPAASLPLFDG